MGGREIAALLTMAGGPRRRLRSHLGSDGSGGAVQSACNGVQRVRVDACRCLVDGEGVSGLATGAQKGRRGLAAVCGREARVQEG
jgi:hypothetical protein